VRRILSFVEQVFQLFFPYEYVSGVARLNSGDWGVEIYVVNRGWKEAMCRTLVIEALGATSNGVFTNALRFNSGDQIIPPGDYAFSQFSPNLTDIGLYWCRIATTSRDLVPSVSFYRPSGGPELSVPDFAFAPGDFDVFSPSHIPLPQIVQPPITADLRTTGP
jgi:hypothetical protein